MPEALHLLYESLMKHQPFGTALYHPLSTTHFKPLSCGYFNHLGQWNAIIQLGDVEAVKKQAYQPLREDPEPAPPELDIQWGPKGSFKMQGKKLDLAVDVCPPGIPATAGAVYQYSDSSNSGAILMTKPFVFRDAVYHEAPYIKWVAENAAALLSKRPEIKEHGLWIVTSTYSTQLCMFNVWSAIDKKISLGFKVSAVNVGEIGPHGEWYEASSDEGWIRYESKEEGERKVVFFGGLKFKYTRAWGHATIVPTKTSGFRSGSGEKNESIPVVSFSTPEDEVYVVECENFLEGQESTKEAGGENEDEDEDDNF